MNIYTSLTGTHDKLLIEKDEKCSLCHCVLVMNFSYFQKCLHRNISMYLLIKTVHYVFIQLFVQYDIQFTF